MGKSYIYKTNVENTLLNGGSKYMLFGLQPYPADVTIKVIQHGLETPKDVEGFRALLRTVAEELVTTDRGYYVDGIYHAEPVRGSDASA